MWDRGAWARCLVLLFYFRAALAPLLAPSARAVTALLCAAQQTRDWSVLDQALHLLTFTYRVRVTERSFTALLADRLHTPSTPNASVPIELPAARRTSLARVGVERLCAKLAHSSTRQPNERTHKRPPPASVLPALAAHADWFGVRLRLERARA